MPRSRAGLLLLLGLLATSRPAGAAFISAPDVVVYCDPTLSPAMQAAGRGYTAQSKVPVRVLSAPGPLLIELISRGTRDDVLVTQANWMDGAAARGLIDPATRYQAWREPVVLAGQDAAPAAALPNAEALAKTLAGGKLGVIDPTQDGGADGPALAERLGWRVPLAGEIDGPAVAFLVTSGAAKLALLPRTSALSRRGVGVVAAVPEELARPIQYAAAVNHNVLSRNTAAFMDYLKSPAAADTLRGAGLETQP